MLLFFGGLSELYYWGAVKANKAGAPEWLIDFLNFNASVYTSIATNGFVSDGGLLELTISIIGLITSIVFGILFYFACIKNGNINEFYKLIFPILVLLDSLFGFFITKMHGMRFICCSELQAFLYYVISFFFRGIGSQKMYANSFRLVIILLAGELIFLSFSYHYLVLNKHNRIYKAKKNDCT